MSSDPLEVTDWPLREQADGTTCYDHVEGPNDYADRPEWAYRRLKTHRNLRCAECGLWKIWIPRADEGSDQP